MFFCEITKLFQQTCGWLLFSPFDFNHFGAVKQEKDFDFPFTALLRMEMGRIMVKRPEPKFQTADVERVYRRHSILRPHRTNAMIDFIKMSGSGKAAQTATLRGGGRLLFLKLVRISVSTELAGPSWPYLATGWKPKPQNSVQVPNFSGGHS